MRKIPSLFLRDWNGDRSRVTREVNPEAQWVIDGEGKATRKWDGTAVLVRGGDLYARFDAKNGKAPPPGFEPAQDPDPETGHWPGWVKVSDQPLYKWHAAAWKYWTETSVAACLPFADGTYELCGPHFQTNPERFDRDLFVRHGEDAIEDAPRSFDALAEWFRGQDLEGIVWHRSDGAMAKIKKCDFGLKRREP